MMSQRKNGRDSVGTLYRVVLGEVAFRYDNVNLQQQGASYGVHTYIQEKCAPFYIHMKTQVCFRLVGLFRFAKSYLLTFYLHYLMIPCCESCEQVS